MICEVLGYNNKPKTINKLKTACAGNVNVNSNVNFNVNVNLNGNKFKPTTLSTICDLRFAKFWLQQ